MQFIIFAVIFLLAGMVPRCSYAQDWGLYAFVPASAPATVLEAVGSGTTEETIVSIGKPVVAANQKWFIIPKGAGYFAIKPSYSSTLVLSVSKGGTENGAQIVLETDAGKPWQQWQLKKNENGAFCIVPRHAPDKGLDDFGGKQAPGSRQDLWINQAGDPHLQWIVRPLAGTPVTAAEANREGSAPAYIAPEIKPEAILKGEIKSFVYSESKVFPGTVRDVSVFIPAQYDGSKAACVYIKTDGYNPIEKTLIETMIATGEMPVTVGIFVRPGDVPAAVKGTIGRRNRDLEYDGVGDDNARFLVDELLPYVAKTYGLKLSTSGNDRCIAGGSSGGIAAFAAAWNRPEEFSRVYAGSGSFVAFRGGNEFPTLVRKFEAKPIRAYLTTGTNDMENCAGDWFLLDQEMDKALRFSGYDYRFRIVNGGHVAGYYENFREGMSYLWKGWPEPIKPGSSAPRARDIILPDESWQLAAQGVVAPSGPACSPTGEVFFASQKENKIYRIDIDAKISTFLSDSGSANSLSFGSDGMLFAGSNVTGKIMSYNSSSKGTLVAQGLRSRYLLAMPEGGLYVTADGEKPGETGSVWLVKDGKKTPVATGLKYAAGMAYRPDRWLLSIADGRSKWAYSYQIGADGTLQNRERFFPLVVSDWEDDAGAASICYAREGQMYVATLSGVQVCADDGPTQVVLPVPDHSRVFGVCLGGRDMDTLFAFCADKIYKRKVKVHAIGAFTPWTRVNGTPL